MSLLCPNALHTESNERTEYNALQQHSTAPKTENHRGDDKSTQNNNNNKTNETQKIFDAQVRQRYKRAANRIKRDNRVHIHAQPKQPRDSKRKTKSQNIISAVHTVHSARLEPVLRIKKKSNMAVSFDTISLFGYCNCSVDRLFQ